MTTLNKVLIGTMSGLVAGVAIGILTAPEKGKDTRDKLGRQAAKLKRKIEEWRGHLSNELDEMEEAFNHEIEGLKDDVRQKVLRMIEEKKNKKMPEPSLS